MSKAFHNNFKVLPQANASTLVEAIRTIYSSDLFSTFSFNIEMAVDVSKTKEVAFTLVSNKKYKEKDKVSSLLFISSSNSKSNTLLIS